MLIYITKKVDSQCETINNFLFIKTSGIIISNLSYKKNMTAKRGIPFAADDAGKSAYVQHCSHAKNSLILETCTEVATKIKMLRSGSKSMLLPPVMNADKLSIIFCCQVSPFDKKKAMAERFKHNS